MIRIGQKVRFDPFEGLKGYGIGDSKGSLVTGTVVFINAPHQWFSVEYGEAKMRTSFKFTDIGQGVMVCG